MRRFIKPALKIAASILVLLLVLVGAGVGYVWYMGQQPSEEVVIAPVPDPPSAPKVTPKKPNPNAAVGASVQLLTTPVKPGSNASITVKTVPTASCAISVIYDKTVSKDSGLATKPADDFGIVSWSWSVEPTVPLGKWPVKVTCTYNKKSAVVQGELEVKAKIDEAESTTSGN